MRVTDLRVVSQLTTEFIDNVQTVLVSSSISDDTLFIRAFIDDHLQPFVDCLDEWADDRTAALAPDVNGRPLAVGDRVRFMLDKVIGDHEFGHGEYGEITAIDSDGVNLHLEKYHSQLDEWGNCFYWDTDDVIYSIGLEPDGEPCPTEEWLRSQVEVVAECTHAFSHLNDYLSGERCCTTCNEQFRTGVPNQRWLLVDTVAEAVCHRAFIQTQSSNQLDGAPYRMLWDTLDGLSNHMLSEHKDKAALHCEQVLRLNNLWPVK